MATFWYIAQPIVQMLVLGLWVWCLFDALRQHRPWPWVVALAFLPVFSAPFYLANFKFFGAPERGRVDGALRDARRRRQLEAEHELLDTPGTNRALGDFHFNRRDFDAAFPYLRRALDMEPEDVRSQYQAGVCLLQAGKPQVAVACLEYVREGDPRFEYGEPRLALALAYDAAGRAEEGAAELEAVVREFTLPEAVVRLAERHVHAGRIPEALSLVNDLLSRVSSMPEPRVRANRAWIAKAKELSVRLST